MIHLFKILWECATDDYSCSSLTLFRLVTCVKFVYAFIQVSNIIVPSVCFKVFNFTFQIWLLSIPEICRPTLLSFVLSGIYITRYDIYARLPAYISEAVTSLVKIVSALIQNAACLTYRMLWLLQCGVCAVMSQQVCKHDRKYNSYNPDDGTDSGPETLV